MEEPILEMQSQGKANLFYKGRHWKRLNLPRRWYKVLYDGRHSTFKNISDARLEALFEEMYQAGSHVKRIQRFPRLDINGVATDLGAIPTISEIARNTSRWLIKDMLLQGTINLLTAPPGGFKTWLAATHLRKSNAGGLLPFKTFPA